MFRDVYSISFLQYVLLVLTVYSINILTLYIVALSNALFYALFARIEHTTFIH